jgi:CheY-like chemotaxis protein
MPPETTSAPGKGRILVAEDDDDFRELLLVALRSDGYEAMGVSNGIDLIDTLVVSSRTELSALPFDLVISDVRMPGVNGLKALTHLKGLVPLPPVVLLTSFADSAVRAQARQCGVVAVLDKPIDLAILVDTVRQILTEGPAAA